MAESVEVNFVEAAEGEKPKLPTFKMLAYSGGELRIAGFYRPVVVDLAGLRASKRVTVLRDHDDRQIIGQSSTVEIGEGDVKIEGAITGTSESANEIVAHARNGFEWPVSIGASIRKLESVGPDTKVKVNGQEFTGPLYVVRAGVLREVSFVGIGADENASAKVAAKAASSDEQEIEEMPKPEDNAAPTPVEPTAAELEAKAEEARKLQATHDAEVATAERTRLDTINAACDKFDGEQVKALKAKAVENEIDMVQLQAGLLDIAREARPGPTIIAGKPSGDALTTEMLTAAACMTGGVDGQELVAEFGEQAVNAADKYRGVGVQGLMRLAAKSEGVELPVLTGTGGEFIRAAFSTLSLPGILANVANKMLLAGYNYVEAVWQQIAAIASVSDFKTHTRYRLTSDMTFQIVGPDGELKHGGLDEQSFTNQADTYGRLFSLTRQMIINDDLSAFTAIPQAFGMGSAEAVNIAVWTLILSNPDSFFHADNGNLLTGAGSALSVAGLTAAELSFLNQTKPNGTPLGIPASRILTPNALKVTAEQLMTSVKLAMTTTANVGQPDTNPHAGKFTPSTSAYLSNSTITGYSATAWYLFVDPKILAAVEVAFLNGVQRPTVERAEADFNTLGMQFRGYFDFGVAMQDPRAAQKNDGA
jgi:hypothetical protein